MLRKAGVSDVRALVGGYEEWVKRGDPIVKGDK
jgi:rhodanese-related sulfurtransferase